MPKKEDFLDDFLGDAGGLPRVARVELEGGLVF